MFSGNSASVSFYEKRSDIREIQSGRMTSMSTHHDAIHRRAIRWPSGDMLQESRLRLVVVDLANVSRGSVDFLRTKTRTVFRTRQHGLFTLAHSDCDTALTRYSGTKLLRFALGKFNRRSQSNDPVTLTPVLLCLGLLCREERPDSPLLRFQVYANRACSCLAPGSSESSNPLACLRLG